MHRACGAEKAPGRRPGAARKPRETPCARQHGARRRRYDGDMENAAETTRAAPCGAPLPTRMARLAKEAFLETLWPTRCAVCDAPGEVLCGPCRQNLPYIDWWRACPRCGAPFGRVQCSECNAVMLQASGREAPPFAGAASAVAYQEGARRVVGAYKDQGERRLAETMATLMAPFVAPAWREGLQAVSFVPATAAACRRRGFDHAELIARGVAEELGLPYIGVFQRPHASDQRKLSRRERMANMRGRLSTLPGATLPRSLLVVDDVCTTGSTLFAAGDALRDAGVEDVFCLTFARTW